MAAQSGLKIVSQGARFMPIAGNAQRWITSEDGARWIDLPRSTQGGFGEASSFIPLKAVNKTDENANAAAGKDPEALQAAQGFEQVFVQYLMKSMRKAVPDGGLLGNSFASGIYQGMFDDYLSEQAGKSNGLGIADMLYGEIVRERQGRVAYRAMAAAGTDTAPSSASPSVTQIEASGASRSDR